MIKYSFTVLVNSAVIVQFHVISSPQELFHPLNIYVYCAVASLGEATTFCHDIVKTLLLTSIVEPYNQVTEAGETVQKSVLFELIVAE